MIKEVNIDIFDSIPYPITSDCSQNAVFTWFLYRLRNGFYGALLIYPKIERRNLITGGKAIIRVNKLFVPLIFLAIKNEERISGT